jgi:hypothetical protein
MKRYQGWVASLFSVAVLAVLSTQAFAAGTDVVWRKKQILWASTTAALTGDSVRVQHIGDENDSTRTAVINTDDWAWDIAHGGTTGNGPTQIAMIECGCTANNGASDSLYYSIEKQTASGRFVRNTTINAAVGTVAFRQGVSQATVALFRGGLTWDPDAAETLNLVGPGANFRLVFKGDVDGTTPALGGCSLWLTYPSRRASAAAR